MSGPVTELLSSRACLLRSVLESPFDDAPRLVMADWLEENGEEERAEFIRVQIELARLGSHVVKPFVAGCNGCERAEVLQRREQQIIYSLPVPGSFWACQSRFGGDGITKWDFRRGFIESVTLTCDSFMEQAGAMFAANPITEAQLSDRTPLGNSGSYRWSSRVDRHGFDASLCLPDALFGLLSTGPECTLIRDAGENWDSVFSIREYATKQEANTALSRACVDFGRKQAGLPSVDWSGK